MCEYGMRPLIIGLLMTWAQQYSGRVALLRRIYIYSNLENECHNYNRKRCNTKHLGTCTPIKLQAMWSTAPVSLHWRLVSHASCARPGFNLHLHLRLHRDLRSLPECLDRHRPREHQTAAKEAWIVIGQVTAPRD